MDKEIKTQTVERKNLLNALKRIKLGVAKKEVVEQSDSFLFKGGKIITYNDDIFATTDSPVDINGAVMAEPLFDLLEKTEDEEISLGIDTDKNELLIGGIKKGRKKFKSGIKFEQGIRLPIDDVTVPAKFISVPSNFSEMCKMCCLSVSKKEDSKLSCIHLGKNKIESCDNTRLSLASIDIGNVEALVPAKALNTILKTIEVNEMAIDNTWIYFKSQEKDDTVLSARLVNDEYIDTSGVLKKYDRKNLETVNFPSKEIKEVLDRAQIFSKDAMTSERYVYVTVTGGKRLVISSINDFGWDREEIEIDTGDENNYAFCISVDYLLGILNMEGSFYVFDDAILFYKDLNPGNGKEENNKRKGKKKKTPTEENFIHVVMLAVK